MNYQTYAKKIAHQFIRNEQESERILKFLFENISRDLAQGKRVFFRGFGGFRKVKRPPKKYRNMMTNKIEVRPAYQDAGFTPSKKLLHQLT